MPHTNEDRTPVSPKVKAGGAAAAAATLVVYIAAQFGLDVPPGVEGAVATLFGVVAGYITP